MSGKPLKYRNKPCMAGGIRFDSRAEAKRWAELKLLERAGQIVRLERQIAFPVIINGVLICKYKPDFCYQEHGVIMGGLICEDVKSPATARNAAYRIKLKLARALYPEWEFREIGK